MKDLMIRILTEALRGMVLTPIKARSQHVSLLMRKEGSQQRMLAHAGRYYITWSIGKTSH